MHNLFGSVPIHNVSVSLRQAFLRTTLLVVLLIVLVALFADTLPSARLWAAPPTPSLRYGSVCGPIVITC